MADTSFSDKATIRPRLGFLYVGIILIGANLRAPITSLGPVLPDIQTALHLNGMGAGALNALPLLIFAILSLVVPSIGRRYGLERVLACALAAILIGTLVRSLAVPGAIWIGTGLLSAGIAFGNVLLPGLVKRDFPATAMKLIGFYAAAMAAAAGLAAGLAVPIAHLPGADWRLAIGCWALLALVTLLVWLPQWTVHQHHLPAATPEFIKAVSPWKHPIGWQVSLFFALHSLVFYSVVDWLPSYEQSSGISTTTAGFYLLIYQVVAVAANLSCAPFIKRFADQKGLGFLCGVLLVVGTGGLYWAPQFAAPFVIIAGLGAGAAMPMSLSLFTLRTRDHHQAAALSGMAQFIGYVGAAAGPFLVGVLHDASHSWKAPLFLLMASSALVTLFATLAGRNRFIE